MGIKQISPVLRHLSLRCVPYCLVHGVYCWCTRGLTHGTITVLAPPLALAAKAMEQLCRTVGLHLCMMQQLGRVK
ncbi:hypothetical protein FH972_025192 [Carpinus fangiana]|uniref:Uncharacterized protein n=1 Tax=Carpinus fangiana TaxID=176857 RepID=A0A5N6L0A8_9ROSI|nr:hypothetical protein FH972_025192 [Carpinus fangiana]